MINKITNKKVINLKRNKKDDEDFNVTFNNLKRAKLSSIHCFPYSRRENTLAYSMPQIQDSIKTERARKIALLSKELHQEFLKENQNTKQ